MNVSHAVTEQVLPLGLCKSFGLSHCHVFLPFLVEAKMEGHKRVLSLVVCKWGSLEALIANLS